MKMKLTALLPFAITVILTSTRICAGEFGPGNGGGLIQSKIISEIGPKILGQLQNTNWGKNLTQKFHLDLTSLQRTLARERILVKSEDEFDFKDPNHQDTDDAVTINGTTIYRYESVLNLITSNINIDSLIFHEMLLSSGYDDSALVICREYKKISSEIFSVYAGYVLNTVDISVGNWHLPVPTNRKTRIIYGHSFADPECQQYDLLGCHNNNQDTWRDLQRIGYFNAADLPMSVYKQTPEASAQILLLCTQTFINLKAKGLKVIAIRFSDIRRNLVLNAPGRNGYLPPDAPRPVVKDFGIYYCDIMYEVSDKD